MEVSNFVFSDFFKDFKSSNADLFVFDNVSITLDEGSISTSTFRGDLRMTGILEPFKTLLNKDTLALTASLETTVGLTEKISPNKLTLSGVEPFHIPLFAGVTLTKTTLQVVMEKDGESWTFTPTLDGILDVDGLTDIDETKIKHQVSLEKKTLKLNAKGKNINGAFGLSQLILDEIGIEGAIGKDEKQLAITTAFEVGETSFNFDGVITPDGVGMTAPAENFTLNELANLFIEVSPANLNLPDFDVNFEKTSIALASANISLGDRTLEKGFTLSTDLTAHGHTFSATGDITPDGVAFSGDIGNLEIGPVTIQEPGLDFQIYKRTANKPSLFTIHGEADIQNVTVDTGVYFEKQASSWETVLYAGVGTESINLSTFFPDTKGSVMDQLSLSKVSFIYASADCKPQRLPSVSSVKKGLQLVGVVKEIPGLSQLTKQDNLDMELTAHIGQTAEISVALPDTRLDLGSSVVTEPFKIAIFVAPQPSIALIFGMEVSIPNQQKPLHFDMMLDISAIEASGSVTMKNWWKNPFGINGLKIGPAVAVELGINYAQFAATGTPSIFGLAGGLAIGDAVMDMAVKITTNPMEQILSGKLKEIDLKEIIEFASDTVGLDIPEDDIPDFLDIKNLELYVAPAGGSIGTIVYEKGMSFACDMEILSKKFQCYARIAEDGIEGSGHMDKIEIGPLEVSGAQGDGLSAGLSLTPSKQALSLDGAISFLGAKRSTFVDISTKGIEFKFEENFFNLLKFQLEGKSSGSISKPKSLDFQLAANMENDITSFLKDDVAKKINDATHTATEGIDAAKKKVEEAERAYRKEYDKAEKDLTKAQRDADAYLQKLTKDLDKAKADYKREFDKAQAGLNRAKATYDKAFNDAKNAVTKAERDYNSGIASAQADVTKAERDYNSGIASAEADVNKAERDYKNSIGSAQNSINSAQRKVNSILRDIESTKRTINGLKWYEKPAAAYYGAKLAAYYTAYGTATAALTAAKGVLEVVKYGGAYVAFNAAKAALHAAKYGARYTAFTAAKAALQAAKYGAKYTAFEGAKATLSAIQHGTEYTAWEAAKQTLNGAKIAGQEAIDLAGDALNNVGRSAVYIALEAAKATLAAVETGSAAVAFGSAKASLEAAKAGTEAVLGLAEYIATHAGDIFDVKRMFISGSLKGLQKGDFFKAQLKVAVLGKDYDWTIDLNIKDVASFIDKLFEMAFNEAKEIAGDLAKAVTGVPASA